VFRFLNSQSEVSQSGLTEQLHPTRERSVPPKPLAETASLGVASGIGGSISDETADSRFQLAQPTPAFSGIGGSISDDSRRDSVYF